MTVILITADGKKVSRYTAPGPSSYTSGGFNVTIPDLVKAEEVLEARLGGYSVEAWTPASGNLVKVIVYSPSAAGTPAEVNPGTDLSSSTLKLLVLGV